MEKVEAGSIQLDNQAIQLKVFMPSGRMQVLDKVSGVLWAMRSGSYSGSIRIELEEGEREYSFGRSGAHGLLFTSNYYMLRNSEEEDFHDVSLTGALDGDSNALVTIRYLLSTTFPVLNCFCYAAGPFLERVKKIVFPFGWNIPHREGNRILLPKNLEELRSGESRHSFSNLWEPAQGEKHLVAGAPFFVMIRKGQGEKVCGCIGYMQHPLSLLEIDQDEAGRYASPSSSRLDETGKSEAKPYRFRCQFIPTDDPEAITWLYREQLLTGEKRMVL
ncbi:MAG: hypothetical protein AB1656_02055 [Candidatus Omnitrophota bacterium]